MTIYSAPVAKVKPPRCRAKAESDKVWYPNRRFDERIEKLENGCWAWTGSKNSNGYGKFNIKGKPVYTHRFSYERFVGPIPDGLTIDHLCHNRICCNPDHLDAVTFAENHRRRRWPKSKHSGRKASSLTDGVGT